MIKRLTVLLILAVLLFAAASCGGNQAPLEPLEGEITDLAGEFIVLLVEGDYKSAAGFFNATMLKAMPARKLGQTWQGLLKQAGPYVGEVDKKTDVVQGFDVVFVTTEFANSNMIIRVVFDSDKRVTGLWFTPAE